RQARKKRSFQMGMGIAPVVGAAVRGGLLPSNQAGSAGPLAPGAAAVRGRAVLMGRVVQVPATTITLPIDEKKGRLSLFPRAKPAPPRQGRSPVPLSPWRTRPACWEDLPLVAPVA